MNNIKLFITDIDGVWTDGGMYYSDNGVEIKKFNTLDSAGIIFCKLLGIEVCIISGEDSKLLINRAKKLKITKCYTGIKNKVKVAESIINEMNISWNDVAFVGDDLNDIKLFRKVGLSACPITSSSYIKREVDWIIDTKGGEGVFRKFVEKFLDNNNLLEKAINLYLENN